MTDSEKYLEQHQYVTSQLTKIVETITSVDPDSVIVLQSDHNYRCSTEDGDLPPTGLEIPPDERKRILNTVYFQGAPLAIDGLTGPETLKLVLNKLGADIPE